MSVAAAAADWWGDYDVPTGLTEDRYVKAIETRPSKDGRFVNHHAIVSVIQDADPFVAGGRPGAGEGGKVISSFSEYVVGKYGDIFSEGSGRLLKAGSVLRFAMHYHSIGEEHTRTRRASASCSIRRGTCRNTSAGGSRCSPRTSTTSKFRPAR